MIKINLDLDDVLNDLSTYWMDVHYEQTGERVIPTHWDLHSLSDHGQMIYNHLREPFFFYNCPMKEGADQLIEFLFSNQRWWR
jgi:5'(3')-deoxyribonucleotidase